MRVIVAPDSLKGSVSAVRAASAIAAGWRSVRPHDEVVELPQADGGEGTLEIVASTVPGAVVRHGGEVTGPDGRPVPSRWVTLPEEVALVECAAVSGLPLMASPDAMGATTRGLGETIAQALDGGASAVWIALGGSASTDGGLGALSALGARATDSNGRSLPDGGGALRSLARLDLSGLRSRPRGGVRLLTDVHAPLLGPGGAARAFGPQKGADAAMIGELERGLGVLARLLGPGAETPGAGAAGGTAYGFVAAWRAEIVSGADTIAEITGLGTAVAGADVIVTGEGRCDSTSFEGKVVGRVLAAAERDSVPAVVIAGEILADVAHGIQLVDLAGTRASALAEPERWLAAAGALAASRATTRYPRTDP